jgi:RHH-type rel operon transcriptional repressor/antitoxin RelB
MLAIRLPNNIAKRLRRLAKPTRRSKTYCARQAILQHRVELEDSYLAETRLKAVRSGRSRSIPLEKVMRRSGLDTKLDA